MTERLIAQKAPHAVEVEEGKDYYWCACGRSKKAPYCDGSHKDTGIRPVKFTAGKTGTVYLCGCKHTANEPFCDGAHKSL
ncbi:MAG: CDGSH iron-sulfur domain-containing protein [Rhodospirillales bacterium]|nr:CDGSH iron-sulfur domain-containing protein [Rhodospirillales bacterium]MCW8863214.1 CDGSH iron-sulfur domain-containing protein [Rhodospirillales bacterium]MCW8952777.1 CDGSH iron-sulfur domain-containing protein [Rhodospirillales bacterium]MCW9001552.1 CDGSH iron-sulfur domain-containing protein [Rhodospirillales bacterium]MCW9039793.1 CDGSH iron-sulfur domain-containing protein [Rhodospirillales bacterium]